MAENLAAKKGSELREKSVGKRRCRRILSIAVLLVSIVSPCLTQGFLHSFGRKIVDANGQEIILRGIGLGNWLVNEGYMMGTADFANSPTEIYNKISSLVGTAYADTFFQTYRNNYITRKDVEKIAEWGFNSIRVPLHYQLFTPKNSPYVYINDGITLIDSLLTWCSENHMLLDPRFTLCSGWTKQS